MRGSAPENITSIDFPTIANELLTKAPALSLILVDIMGTTKPEALLTSAAVISKQFTNSPYCWSVA